jgi:hypothetical protein
MAASGVGTGSAAFAAGVTVASGRKAAATARDRRMGEVRMVTPSELSMNG